MGYYTSPYRVCGSFDISCSCNKYGSSGEVNMFAIAEFGSTTRKTQDCHSDRDLLIVCELKTSREFVKNYCEQGYSVTLLTPSQLTFMQKRGSLFIQHLKHESRILMDTNTEFSKWLQSCPLIAPSEEEIQKCFSTIEF